MNNLEWVDLTPDMESRALQRQLAFVAGALRRDLLMRYGDLTGISPSLSVECMADEQWQTALDNLDSDFPTWNATKDIIFQSYESGLEVLCRYFGEDNVKMGELTYIVRSNLKRTW